ncbi:MAG TPA: hypothetical protein VGG25_04500 [Streptosporangiaceae bacterium]|jgi:hypothetical protein
MQVTRKIIGECAGNQCAAIYETDDPDMFAVQGATLADAQAMAGFGSLPGNETVVLVPRNILTEFADER